MKCKNPQCNNILPDNALYCPVCGKKQFSTKCKVNFCSVYPSFTRPNEKILLKWEGENVKSIKIDDTEYTASSNIYLYPSVSREYKIDFISQEGEVCSKSVYVQVSNKDERLLDENDTLRKKNNFLLISMLLIIVIALLALIFFFINIPNKENSVVNKPTKTQIVDGSNSQQTCVDVPVEDIPLGKEDPYIDYKPSDTNTNLNKNQDFILDNGVTFTMIYVKGGSYTMGCTSEQNGFCDSDEYPTRYFNVNDFLIGQTEVTQSLWQTVMGNTISDLRDKANPNYPLYGEGFNCPIYYVTHIEALEFCKKLNNKLRYSLPEGYYFTLPNEVQWEYAARGGIYSDNYIYSGSNNINNVGWFKDNSYNKNHTVALKTPNKLGLYDMCGNVYEWCLDVYEASTPSQQISNIPNYSEWTECVLRGGSWSVGEKSCRVTNRGKHRRTMRGTDCGFRVVLTKK